MTPEPLKVTILGAGAVGCYLGAVLSQTHDVTLIARDRIVSELNRAGQLTLTDYTGRQQTCLLPTLTTDANALAGADLIILTVKCLGVDDAASQIQAFSNPETPLLCLQNGIGSDERLRHLPNPVIRGIVGFNVAPMGKGRFHRGTEGDVWCETFDPVSLTHALDQAFQSSGFSLLTTADFEALQWGKLQLNLNNAINALSDMPLKQELETHGYRKVLSLAMSELLAITRQQNLKLPRLTKLPPGLLPLLLRVPDALFRRLASSMLAIDPEARSSMWEDLSNRRLTEISYINGAVVRAAEALGQKAPANATLVAMIKDIEEGRQAPGIPCEKILEEIKKRR